MSYEQEKEFDNPKVATEIYFNEIQLFFEEITF